MNGITIAGTGHKENCRKPTGDCRIKMTFCKPKRAIIQSCMSAVYIRILYAKRLEGPFHVARSLEYKTQNNPLFPALYAAIRKINFKHSACRAMLTRNIQAFVLQKSCAQLNFSGSLFCVICKSASISGAADGLKWYTVPVHSQSLYCTLDRGGKNVVHFCSRHLV